MQSSGTGCDRRDCQEISSLVLCRPFYDAINYARHLNAQTIGTFLVKRSLWNKDANVIHAGDILFNGFFPMTNSCNSLNIGIDEYFHCIFLLNYMTISDKRLSRRVNPVVYVRHTPILADHVKVYLSSIGIME